MTKRSGGYPGLAVHGQGTLQLRQLKPADRYDYRPLPKQPGVPIMVCMDGFILTHAHACINVLS